MDAAASARNRDRRAACRERSRCARTNGADADGEVAWSWRLDAGVKFCGGVSAQPGADPLPIRKTTVTTRPDHRGDREGSR